MKLTEDKIVVFLKNYLESTGWFIGDNFRLGHKHGLDIKATKNGQTLVVEAKGAKASDNAHNKKRKQFDSGQIKVHFGKAIVKMLEEKLKDPKATLAIAHPDDSDIRKHIGELTPFLKDLGIKHYWVDEKGNVTED